MRFLLLGCGLVGHAIAHFLVNSPIVHELIILDRDEERLRSIASRLQSDKVEYLTGDASNSSFLSRIMDRTDIVIDALPGNLGYNAMKTAIDSGVNIVDISYMPENPLTLNDLAKQRGVLAIPDAGLAPGLSNLLVGHATSLLDTIDSVRILVGGLPQKRDPPLEYCTTWSITDLIEEYTRPARIVRDGKIISVPALTGLERVQFEELGELEAFYTDGLRTLLYTIKARNMEEKTLRYPGHAEKIRLLIELGFFDTDSIKIKDTSITPRDFTIELLRRKIICTDEKDLVVMRVSISGEKAGDRIKIIYDLIDYFDEKTSLTAMSRTTGFTASIIAQLVAQKILRGSGVMPLELIGQNPVIFNKMLSELNAHGINIREKIQMLR